MATHGRQTALIIALLASMAGALAAQDPELPPFPAGRLIEDVVVTTDPTHSYSLYLPSDYATQDDWPLLFVMDPRGRGSRAARIFLEGAERYGYILVSSNNTRSDGDMLPNQVAINVTLPEIARRFSVRSGELYLTGMSGTSRVAWLAGHLMDTAVAGVIGTAGATAGGSIQPGPETRFPYFGVAANRDFNYREMLQVHDDLIEVGAVSRLAYVNGGHSWPPVETATQALGWMRLQAFRQGRQPMDPELIDQLLAAVRKSASDHESAGRELDALQTYRGIVEDFGALRPTDFDRSAIARLGSSETANRQRQERRRGARREAAYPGRIAAATTRLKTDSPPPPVDLLADELDIETLLAAATERPQTEDGLAAQRMLSSLYSQMSFYLFRQLYQADEWGRAESGLEVAFLLRPDDPGLLYNLACVRARAGRKKKALETLAQAVSAGFSDRDMLTGDDDLKTLRALPGYPGIVARIAAGDTPAAEGAGSEVTGSDESAPDLAESDDLESGNPGPGDSR